MVLSTCRRLVMGVVALIVLCAALMPDANAQRQCPSTYYYNKYRPTEFEPDSAYIESSNFNIFSMFKAQ